MVATALPAVLGETTITFADAPRHVPEVGGRRVAAKTVREWARVGLLAGGGRVLLESARVGGRRVTSVEAIGRFLAATSGAAASPTVRSPAAVRRSSEVALASALAKIRGAGRR